MHKGELRESGTHRELLARRGIYHKLYETQFSFADKVRNHAGI
jgi:ATP-binding cassette subfamily B multidrug efflux pump